LEDNFQFVRDGEKNLIININLKSNTISFARFLNRRFENDIITLTLTVMKEILLRGFNGNYDNLQMGNNLE